MPKIVVLGFHGQLASEIRMMKRDDPNYVFLPKEEIVSNNYLWLENRLRSLAPDFVINCTAYTAVDRAEIEKDVCLQLNRDFVGSLATASARLNFHLIHFSTDYVFSGDTRSPYKETDATSPVNFYGQSKLLGEQLIRQHARSASIVRTSWLYSLFGSNFVKTMLRIADQQQELRVVSDQVGCPTWAADLAAFAIGPLLLKTDAVDILHFAGEGETSWSTFASEIMTVWEKQVPVKGIKTSEYPTAAARPRYSVLSKDKVRAQYGTTIPHWRDSIRECYEKSLRSNNWK